MGFLRQLSLRTKLTLCMVLLSLASILAVGWFAEDALLRKFDDLINQDAGRRFSREVAAYIRTYGSWQAGLAHESFRSFSQRNAPVINAPGPGLNPPPGLRPGARPDLPPGAMPGPDRPAPGSISTMPQGTPQLPPSNLTRPPFRFYLFDTQFHALFKLPPYEIGDPATSEHRARMLPIRDGEQVVAYFIPDGKPNYSDLDLGYIAAMRSALVTGGAAAALLAVALGLFLSHRLSRGLRQLTRAAQAMEAGQLRQHVEIAAQDEVGKLAQAFNQMSERLFNADRALRESHAQVEQQAMQLKELSIRDALTHLHNRRHFDEQAGHLLRLARRHGKPFSAMIGDIDHFKQINDRHSHATGDAVLRQVGAILASRVRGTDLVARYGGEEFVVAFPETALEDARKCCEELRRHIQNHDWAQVEPGLSVTMSMGVTAAPVPEDIDELVARADRLLYEAKRGGRNRVCADPGAHAAH